MKFRKHRKYLLAIACLSVSGFSTQAMAQQSDDADVTRLEEIVVTGARGRPRTVSDSPVPIDVFTAADLRAVSYTDTNDILKTLVPSFNLGRQPISDGASFIRPATLRGLPTDKTLMLINSKRRHRAALVSIGGSGTQGPDIATIPSIALKNIEVLRDGASAQYGSDAIAGVINFILKDASEGASFSIDGGEYSEGDGAQQTIQGNIGLPLGENGFLNLSGSYYTADAASRSEQYCEGWACVDPNGGSTLSSFATDPAYAAGLANANIGYGDVVQPWGQPEQEATRFFFNAGYQIDADTEAYAFGNYSESESDGSFFYRYKGNGTIEELREADGGIYTPLEKYPGGFTPRFFGEVFDFSILAGIKGTFDNGLGYDFSGRRGESEIRYTLSNTVNPSMGRASPKSFRPGDLINQETQFQADFTYEFDSDMASPLLLAFGGSYMDESYEVVEGEPASFLAGPHSLKDPFDFCNADMTASAAGAAVIAGGSTLDCANTSDPVYRVVGVGSNGFPGYSPQFSEVYERSSYAVYADLSADVTDQLFLQGAVRYEDYDDFDSELVAKVAGLYRLTDNVNIRGSIGTGFRAPTPGQQGTINVSTRLPNGFPVATGLFPAGGPVAGALGAVPLVPETSTNYTIGFTASFGDLDMTVDFYRILLDDATYAISTRPVSTDPTSGEAYQNFLLLDAAGVSGANSIGGVLYFTNGFDVSSEGVDIVATYPLSGEWGTTNFTASLGYNERDFESDPSAYRNEEARFDYRNYNPNWRGVFTAVHNTGDLTLIGRASYWGESENANSGTSRRQVQDGIWFVDIEGQYQINDTFRISAGGRNVFDEYPEKGTVGDTCCGRVYESGSQVDWHGAYYFARITASF